MTSQTPRTTPPGVTDAATLAETVRRCVMLSMALTQPTGYTHDDYALVVLIGACLALAFAAELAHGLQTVLP